MTEGRTRSACASYSNLLFTFSSVLHPSNVASKRFLQNNPFFRNSCPASRRCAVRMDVSSSPREEVKIGVTTKPFAQPSEPGVFDWVNQWYPVLLERDFDSKVPYAFKLYDNPLVMFKESSSGEFVVMSDICPHRAAPLSAGRLYERSKPGTDGAERETVLECPYHGWAFNHRGACVRIPQMMDHQPIPKAANCKRRFATTVKNGLVFVWFGDPATADPAKVPMPDFFDRYPEVRLHRDQTRILPYDFTTFFENVIDPAHVPWTHHGTGAGNGDRNQMSPTARIRLLDVSDPAVGIFSAACRVRETQSVESIMTFHPPTTVSYLMDLPLFGKLMVVAMASPESRGRTRLVSFQAFAEPTVFGRIFESLPRFHQHNAANLVLDGDLVVLRAQERFMQKEKPDGFGGAWKRNFVLSTNSMDSAVLQYRKWLDTQSANIPWSRPPTPVLDNEPLSRAQMLNRYEQHTAHCKSCQAMLRSLRFVRRALLVLAALCAVGGVAAGMLIALGSQTAATVAAPPLGWCAGPTLAALVALLFSGKVHYWTSFFTYTEIAHKLQHSD